jgi:DNA-binding transcriptional LysR family regulator
MALVRRGHELVGKTLTARRYVAHAHVAVQLRTQAASPVDRALAGLGLERRIVMTVAQANIAPIVAARSDLVATISERTALAMASALGLEVLPLGFATEPEPMVMAWHPRHSSDPAHAWLRETMVRVIKGEAHAPPRRPLQARPRRSVSHP